MMRRIFSVQTVKMMAAIAGAVAAICLAVTVIILVRTVEDQQDLILNQRGQIARQSLELECRGQLAAESDVLRNEVALWLSRGLRGIVLEDEPGVNNAVMQLELLDIEIAEVNARRERTIEICSERDG